MNNHEFCAFVPVVNRFDLLKQVYEAAGQAGILEVLFIIDNSPNGVTEDLRTEFAQNGVNLYRPPIPLSFTQSMNLEFRITRARCKKLCLHSHSDAVIPSGAIKQVLDCARGAEALGRKWGVVYSLYDVLAVYNPVAGEDIGGYDTNFANYFSDNDFYRRLKLSGYELIESNVKVDHIGSQTVNSDPYLKYVTGITFPLARQYYVAKWGGDPGKEMFREPFNGAWKPKFSAILK